MKCKLCGLVFLLHLVLFLLTLGGAAAQGTGVEQDNSLLPTPTEKRDLYPAAADAAKEIEAALVLAAADHKRVLLVFGGNWCYDCHVLDRGLHEGEAGKIMRASYLLVHVDIGNGEKNLNLLKKYEIPIEKGVPAVAVLSSDEALLYSSGDGEFEAARNMKKKNLVAFLNRWVERK